MSFFEYILSISSTSPYASLLIAAWASTLSLPILFAGPKAKPDSGLRAYLAIDEISVSFLSSCLNMWKYFLNSRFIKYTLIALAVCSDSHIAYILQYLLICFMVSIRPA
uniref:Uncharacterized protein n=1 Tax=uncultured marine virus TaxID=186617 RepID=A0A0F7LBF1_9VIRU|nr:hypothetical protein [uncultured marine virus]